MERKITFSDYKGLSQEELKKLPVEELVRALHEAIIEWDKLNQRLNQDSTNSNRPPSSDSPEAKAKRKAEEKTEHQKQGTRKQGAQPGHDAVSRPLIPLGENDTAIDCKPKTCAHAFGEMVALFADFTWTYFRTTVAFNLETHGLRQE